MTRRRGAHGTPSAPETAATSEAALSVDEGVFAAGPLQRVQWLFEASPGPGDLYVLAHDEDDMVREAVASHPATPRAALRILATREHPHLAARALRRPYLPAALPGEILIAFDQSGNAYLGGYRNHLWKSATLELPVASQRLLLSGTGHLPPQQRRALLQLLAAAPYLADDVAEELMGDASPVVREAVAERLDLSEEAHERVHLKRSQRQRKADTSWLLDRQERMALGPASHDAKRLLEAASEPASVDAHRTSLLTQRDGHWIDPVDAVVCLRADPADPDVISAAAASANPAVRALVAARAADAAAVEHLIGDREVIVRAALASRADLPPAALTTMLADVDLGTAREAVDLVGRDAASLGRLIEALPPLPEASWFPDDRCLAASTLRRRIVEREDLPQPAQLEIARAGDPVIAAFLAERDGLSDAVVEALRLRPEFAVVEALVDAGHLPEETIPWLPLQAAVERLHAETFGHDFSMEQLALTSGAPHAAIQSLLCLPPQRSLRALAVHGADLAPETQIAVAHGDYWDGRELAFSGGSDLVEEAKAVLEQTNDDDVRRALARVGAPRSHQRRAIVTVDITWNLGDELEQLGTQGQAYSERTLDETAMLAIATDPALLALATPDLLVAFISNGTLAVGRALVEHLDVIAEAPFLTTEATFPAFAYSRFYVVRRAFARQLARGVPRKLDPGHRRMLLTLMAQDDDENVREITRRALRPARGSQPPEAGAQDPVDAIIDRGDTDECLALIADEGALQALSADQQVRLANHRSVDVPRALARNSPLLDPAAHAALARSRIFTARRELARTAGRQLDPEILDLLAEDDDDVVRRIARAARGDR